LNDGTPNSLGIDAIWLNPFYPSPQFDFGYDVMDIRGVDPQYGTMQDFDTLLAEAHKRGIKIIMDIVPGHTSHLHPWFIESSLEQAQSKRDWYF
jgi:alpha-glucosidase